MSPRSTSLSSTSCWLLLNRWISSRKRIVRLPSSSSRFEASSMISRMRLTPTLLAFSRTKCRLVCLAISSASVVFPVPGGPWKMSEVTASAWSIRRSSFPSPKYVQLPRKLRQRPRAQAHRQGITPRRACSHCRPRDQLVGAFGSLGEVGSGKAEVGSGNADTTAQYRSYFRLPPTHFRLRECLLTCLPRDDRPGHHSRRRRPYRGLPLALDHG